MTLEQYIQNINSVYSRAISTKLTVINIPNLEPEIANEIAKKLGLTFVVENKNGNVCFANNKDELRDEFKQIFELIDILDYIYAVLHSSIYRGKYKDFPKTNFPENLYPKNVENF